MTVKFHINGLIPAVFTPMHSDGSLNLDLIKPITDYLIENGVAGLYVCGSTGEGPSLMREERLAVTESYIQAAAGRVPIIVQVGHNSIHEAKLLAAHAQKHGADAISAVPPSYFKPTSLENLVCILAEMMNAAPDLPFYYYHIPRLSSVHIDVVKLLEMAVERLPNLAGVKYSTFTVYEMQACLEVDNGRYNMLFGSDEMLFSGLVAGAHGAVGSTYNFAMPLYNRVVAAFKGSNINEAQRNQALAAKMIRQILLVKDGNSTLKSMMKYIGFDCGPVRLPQESLTPDEEKQLHTLLKEIGFFDWGR